MQKPDVKKLIAQPIVYNQVGSFFQQFLNIRMLKWQKFGNFSATWNVFTKEPIMLNS